ncbi:Dynein heavy chain 6 [Phytophthora citrophthora]|uniref:Dynein heavy chain 6 n=1 Tax=Phytophthora citrophthora TaxID=4793 RepID=A0AAD9GMY4_9STRA|nr:Dynein heavy chain 6 [Phytophthora citrophthora]
MRVFSNGSRQASYIMEEFPAQKALKADGETSVDVELPRVLSSYVTVLHGQEEGDKQIALMMDQRNISPQRVVCLLGFVAQLNTPLIRLCLSKNPLGPEGARLLGNALVTNNTLQFLELDACDLVGSAYRPQHDGILALSKGIQSVRSRLHYINIASNALQPEGCRILLGAMSFHKTLTALDISDNMLSLFNDKQGYLALSYLLQYSKQLCWLNIADNPLTTAAASTLTTSLASNHSLTSLNTDHVRFGAPPKLRPRTAGASRSSLPHNELSQVEATSTPEQLASSVNALKQSSSVLLRQRLQSPRPGSATPQQTPRAPGTAMSTTRQVSRHRMQLVQDQSNVLSGNQREDAELEMLITTDSTKEDAVRPGVASNTRSTSKRPFSAAAALYRSNLLNRQEKVTVEIFPGRPTGGIKRPHSAAARSRYQPLKVRDKSSSSLVSCLSVLSRSSKAARRDRLLASTRENNDNTFVYAVPRHFLEHGLPYDPYDIFPVTHEKLFGGGSINQMQDARWDYYTISRAGYTFHLKKDDFRSTFLSLSDWETQKAQFTKLRSLSTFSRFRYRKVFVSWRQWIRSSKREAARENLITNCFFSYPILFSGMLEVRKELDQVSKLQLMLDFSGECSSLQDFTTANDKFLKARTKELHRITSRLQTILTGVCRGFVDDTAPLHAGFPGHEFALSVRKSSNYHILEGYVQCEQGLASAHQQFLQHKHFRSTRLATSEAVEARKALMLSSIQENTSSQTGNTLRSMAPTDELEDIRWTMASIKRRKCKQLTKFITLVDFLLLETFSRVIKQSLDLCHDFILRGANAATIRRLTDHDDLVVAMHKTLRCSSQPTEEGITDPNVPKPYYRQRIPFKKQQIKAFLHTAWEGKLCADSDKNASLSTFSMENRLEELFFFGLDKLTGSSTEAFSIDDLLFVAENSLIQLLVLPTFNAEAYSTDKEASNIPIGDSSSTVEQGVLEIPCLGPQPLFTMNVATSAILEKRGRPKYEICFKPDLAALVRILQSIIQGFTDVFRAVPPLLSSPELRSVLDFADDIRALNLHSAFATTTRENVTSTRDLEASDDDGDRFRCPADRLVERMEENSHYLSVRDDIQDLVRSALNGAEDLATSYSNLLHLRQQNEGVNFELKARLFRRNEYSLDEMTNDATNFTNQICALEALRLSANVEFLHFDMQQLQTELLPSPARCLDAMRELLPRLLRERCGLFLQYVNISSSKIEKPITPDLDAFTKYLLNLRDVHDEILDKELDLTFLHNFFGVLNALRYSAPVETTKAFELCDPEFQALKTHVQDAYTKRDADLQSYASLLAENLEKLTRRLSALQSSASDEALAAQSSTCQQARDKAVKLFEESQNELEEARRLVRIQQVFEEASSGPRPPMKMFEDLDELAVELKLKRELWEAVCEADEHLTACSSDTIRSVDLEKMNAVATHVDTVVENIRQYSGQVAGFELDRLEKLQTTLHGLAPVIRDLRNPHLAERHWTKLEHKMQCSLLPERIENESAEVLETDEASALEPTNTSSRLDLQIEQLLQANAVIHSTTIRHVSEEASAEAAVASSFMSVVRTWETQEIPVEARRDRDGRDVYCIGDCGELTSLIEESQVLLRVMDLSTYSLVVQERLPRMLSDLNHTKESLELLQVCQRKWDFTQRLVSIDFARTFPEQAKQLQRHDTMWRSLTMGIFNRSLCLPFGVSSEHRQSLLLILEGFEAAAKTLADHLEIKRQVFPAFFQLSDLELATLLSKSRDVNCISSFLYQCFDNVGEIIFGTRDKFQDILQITSRAYGEAEMIPMGKNLKARGPVEQWLAAIEKRLAEQLRRSTKQAIELMRFDSDCDQPSDVDISRFTVQSLLLADRILRCGIIETGLQDILNSTRNSRFERITSDLNAYSERVRYQLVPGTVLSPREIALRSALRLQEIQFRDALASHMASKQAENYIWSGNLAVDWDYQLKYRMDDASTVGHECHVEVNTLNIPYGFHYSSPHSDVVVTPSSFRSLFSLFACIRHGQSCLLTGGLESGKRTLSTQVSSILGRRHFTATLTSYTHATRLIIGALYAGGTFCGTFQLEDDDACLIKTLATTLASIEHAVVTKNAIVGIHRSPITFVPGTAMLVVLPSGTELTEDIRIWTEALSHFAIVQWDREYIVEALLVSRGFTDSQRLAKQLLIWWENSRSTYALETGSDESPFSFSALKRVVNEAYQPAKCQEFMIRDALLSYFQGRIDADQLKTLETLIDNMFPAPATDFSIQHTEATTGLQEIVRSAAQELNLIRRNRMICSVLELAAALTVSTSTILVGPSGVGKTTTYQVLAKTLELISQRDEEISTATSEIMAPLPTPVPQVSVNVVLPMALTVTQLYGGISLDGHGRVPSVLGQLIHQAQELYVPPTTILAEKSVTVDTTEPLLNLKHQVWVVFDDSLHVRWLEGLLAVLVNPMSDLLAFQDGEFMTLPPNLRFIFEVLTLRDATPSFLHVNSILHLEPDKKMVLPELHSNVRRAIPESTMAISTAYLHRYLTLQREKMGENEGSKWSSGDTFTVVEKWLIRSSVLEEVGTILDTGSADMIQLSPLQRVTNLVSLLQSLLSTASTLPITSPRIVKAEKMSAIPDSMLQFDQEISTGQIRVEMALIYSFMWGFAACTGEFNAIQRQISDVLRREFDHLTASWVRCGPNVNLFETLLDLQELRFVSVVGSTGLIALPPQSLDFSSFNSLFVPTSSSLVVHATIREALRSGRGVLLLGGDNSRRTTLTRHFLGQLEVIRSIIAANGVSNMVKTQKNNEESDKTPKQKIMEAATLVSVKRLRLRQISLVTWMALKLQKDPSSSENTTDSIANTSATDNRDIVEAEEGAPLAITPSMDASKTAMIRQFDRGDVIPFFFGMPHNGEAAVELADCFERMLQRERTGIFEPPPGKTALLLLDDLHLSTPGSSKPLYPSVYTLLRSVQEHRKVYQGSNCLPISVENLMLFATMHVGRCQNPGDSEEALEKLTSQFFPVLSPSCGLEELHNIFEQALKSHWNVSKPTGTLTAAVKNALPLVISATTVLWNRFRETYKYNLQDLAKVYGALAVVKPTLISDVETLLRLWTHESCRTLREPSMGLRSIQQDTEVAVEIARMRSLVAQITQRRASARASRLSFGAGMGSNFVPKRQSIVNQPSTDENVSPAALLALFAARISVSSSKTQRPSVQFNSIQDQTELMGGLWAFVPSSIYYGGQSNLTPANDSESSVFRRRASLMRRGLEGGDSITKPWIYAEIIFEDESEAMATATMQMYFRDLRTFSSTTMQLRPGNLKEGVTLPRDGSLVPFKLALTVTRIDRVLARPAARLVLLTDTGSGADTLLRFATVSRLPETSEFPVESGIFTFSGLKSDRNVPNSSHVLERRWKRLLLELYEHVGVAGQEATLVIKRLDLLPVAILNQIQTLMTTGEVPGVFSLEEQVHIATRVCDERLLALKSKHQAQVAQIRTQAESTRDEALAGLHQQQREAPSTPLLDAFKLVEMKFQRELRSKLARVDLRWQQDTDDLRRQREVESESVAATVMALTRPLGVTSGKWASAVARMCSKLRVVLVVDKKQEERVRTTSPSLFSTCDIVSVPRADRESLRTLVYGHFNAQFQQFRLEDDGFNAFLNELQRGLWSVACMATDMYLAIESIALKGEKTPLSRIFAMASFFPKFVLEFYNREEASRAKTAWFLELSNRLDRDLGALRSSDILLSEQLSTVDQQLVEHEAKLVQQKEDADRIRVIMQRFQAAADEQITVTNEAQAIAQQELREPMACLEEANRALLLVDRRHIVEIKSFVSPPPLVHLVLGAVCVLFQLEPSWESARRLLLGDANVVQTLLQFNKDVVTATTLSKLETEFLSDERFSKEEVERQSVAAASMVNWVRAIHQYATARRQVQPTLDKLEKAQCRLQMIMKEFQVSQQRVLEADGAWRATQMAIDTAITRKTALRGEIASLDARCDSGGLALEALKEDRNKQQEAASCNSMRRGFSLTTWNALLSAGTLVFACELGDFSIRHRVFRAWEAAYYHYGGLTPGCPPTSTQCTFLPSIAVILKRSERMKDETPLTSLFSGECVEFEDFTKLISRVGGLGFSRRRLWDVWMLDLIEAVSLPMMITRFSSEIEELVVKCAKRVWNWSQFYMVYARAPDFDDVFRVAAQLGQQLVVLDVEPIDSEPNGSAKCLSAAFSWEIKEINGAKHLVVARKIPEDEDYTMDDKKSADTIALHPNFRLILTSHASRSAFGDVLDLFPTLDGHLHSSDVAEVLLDTLWNSSDTGKDLKMALKSNCGLVEQYEAGHSQLTKLLEAAAVTSQFPLSQTKALRERLAAVQEVREELRENRRAVQEQLRIVKRQSTPMARTGAVVFNAFNSSSSTPLGLQGFTPLLLAAVAPGNNELTTPMLKDTKAPLSRRISLLRRGSVAFSRQSSSLGESSDNLSSVLTRIKPFVSPKDWYRFVLQVISSLEEIGYNPPESDGDEVDELIPRSVDTILLQTKLKSSFITAGKCKTALSSSSCVDFQRKVVNTILNGSMLESEADSVDSIAHLALSQAPSRAERLRVSLLMFPECTQHVCDRMLTVYGVPLNLQREVETEGSFWLQSMQSLPEETAIIVCTRHEFHSFGFARRVFFQGLENSASLQIHLLQKLSERRFRSVEKDQTVVDLAQLYNFPTFVNSGEGDQESEMKKLIHLAADFKRIMDLEKTQLQVLEEAPLAVVNMTENGARNYWEAFLQILNRSNGRTSSSAFQRHDRSSVPAGEALLRRPSTLVREGSVIFKPPPLGKSLTRRTSTSQSLIQRRSVVDLMAPTYPRLVAAVDGLSSLPVYLRSNIVCFRDEYEARSDEPSACFRRCLQSTILRLVLYPSVQTVSTLVQSSEADVVRVPVHYFWQVVTGLVLFHSMLVFRANVLRMVYPETLTPSGVFHYSDGEFLTAINQFLTTIFEKKHHNSPPQRTHRTSGYNAALDRRMYQQIVLSSYVRQAAGRQELEFLKKLFTECLKLTTCHEPSSGDGNLSFIQGNSRRMTVRGQLRPPNTTVHSPSVPLIRGLSTISIANSSTTLGFLSFPAEALHPTDLSMDQWLELLWGYALTIDQHKDSKLQTVLLGCQQSSSNRRGSLEDACKDVTTISGIEMGKCISPTWMRAYGWHSGDVLGEIASTILLRDAIKVLRAINAEALPPRCDLELSSEAELSTATRTKLVITNVYNQHIESWSAALEKILSSLQTLQAPDNGANVVDALLEDPESGDEDDSDEESDGNEGNILHLVDMEDVQVRQQVVAILSNEVPTGFVSQTTYPPTWSLHDVLQHYRDWHEFLNSTANSTEPSRWWLPGIIASGLSLSYILDIAQPSNSLLEFTLRLPPVEEAAEPLDNTSTVAVIDGLVLLGATWNENNLQIESTSDIQAHQRVQLICSASREKTVPPLLQQVPLVCFGGGAILFECPLPIDTSSLNSIISSFLMPVGSHYR